jgi:hypothetical protein
MTDIERIVAAIAGYLDGLESVGDTAATDVSDGPNRRYLVDGVIDLADMAKAIAEVRSAAAGGGAMSAGDARASGGDGGVEWISAGYIDASGRHVR